MAIQHQEETHSFLLDALYCEEEKEQWDEDEEVVGGEEGLDEERETHSSGNNGTNHRPSLLPLLLLEHDLFWEDEELLSLFSREQQQQQQQTHLKSFEEDHPSLSSARREAVEWILKVNSFYGFTTLTAILAINYLDRFLCSLHFQRDKPWMIQLSAVTCLSLAAKVEETQVPLLLDLQVEDTKFVFEAKTIQRMEILVLSTLQWRMNPVTPLSFLDHIIRRLGLKTHLHWEFLRRCEALLLSLLTDSRFVCYLPSVLATATMLHVIRQIELSNPIEYQNQLLGILKISKEKVNDCYEVIVDQLSRSGCHGQNNPHKRKCQQIPSSPSGVIDAILLSSDDSSNESWGLVGGGSPEQPQPQPQPQPPLFKKSRRVQEQQMRLPSLNRVFVDALGTPH